MTAVSRRNVLTGITLAALASVALSALAGTAEAQEKKRIAFVVGNVSDAFYQKAHEGAQKAAERLGVELLYQGPNEFSAQAQIPVIDTLLAQKPDAIAIAPTDPTALVAPLQKWADAGIPIVTYDSGLANPPFAVVSEISSGNYSGGEMAAEQMARLIGGKGEVAIVDLNTSNKVLTDRKDGFMNLLKDKYPDIKVVDVQLTDIDFPRAQTIVQTFVNKYPDLVGIFTTYSFATEYGAAGLLSLGAQERVKLVGFEAGPKEIQYLRQGVLQATVAQQPALEGEKAVEAAYYAATGQTDKIEKSVSLPDVVITSENVDEMKQYYYEIAK